MNPRTQRKQNSRGARNLESGLYAVEHFLSIIEELVYTSNNVTLRVYMRHKGWMICSGMLWVLIGTWLLYKGIHLVAEGAFGSDIKHSSISRLFGAAEDGANAVIGIGLIIGFFKGRFVLSKTAKRVCSRILSLPLPLKASKIYSSSYLLLLLGMMTLGITLRFLPIPLDLKGFIDIAVGSALINGSIFYFRFARSAVFIENH